MPGGDGAVADSGRTPDRAMSGAYDPPCPLPSSRRAFFCLSCRVRPHGRPLRTVEPCAGRASAACRARPAPIPAARGPSPPLTRTASSDRRAVRGSRVDRVPCSPGSDPRCAGPLSATHTGGLFEGSHRGPVARRPRAVFARLRSPLRGAPLRRSHGYRCLDRGVGLVADEFEILERVVEKRIGPPPDRQLRR